jgi:hypothetical protein
VPLLYLFRDSDERLAGPHDDRLLKVNPAAVGKSGRRQRAQALAIAGVALEDPDIPPASTPSRWKRGMMRSSAKRNVNQGSW